MKAIDIHEQLYRVGDDTNLDITRLTEKSRLLLKEIIELTAKVKSEYGRKHFWITACSNDGDEFFHIKLDLDTDIYINGILVGSIDDPQKNNRRPYRRYSETENEIEYDFAELFKWVFVGIKKAIAMMKEGTYKDYILNHLPYTHRSGVIRLKDYWKFCPDEKNKHFREYDMVLVDEFKQWYKLNKKETKMIGYDVMTPAMFYRACYYVYKSMEYEVEELSPKEAYLRYSDGRDMGFSELPDDDYEALKAWRQDFGHGDHANEIIRNRVEMWFGLNKVGKWQLYIMSVFGEDSKNELLRLVMAMHKAGYPIDLSYYKDKEKLFKGKVLAGITPINSSFDHMRIIECTSFDIVKYVHMPSLLTEELKEKIYWLEPRICELISDEGEK